MPAPVLRELGQELAVLPIENSQPHMEDGVEPPKIIPGFAPSVYFFARVHIAPSLHRVARASGRMKRGLIG